VPVVGEWGRAAATEVIAELFGFAAIGIPGTNSSDTPLFGFLIMRLR
jgi:hypothetical protein